MNEKCAAVVAASPAPVLYDRLGYLDQPENRAHPRLHGATLSTRSYPPSLPESTKSSPSARSLPNALSPAPSISGSSSSGNSVHWGENDDSDRRRIPPGQYSTQSQKSSPKTVLKGPKCEAANIPPLFAESAPIVAASAAVDSVLCDLCICVNELKRPSKLYFSANTGSPLILANVGENKPFINQLHKLEWLRTRLAEIPKHGDALLVEKHRLADAAIGRAFQRMKEFQLKQYDKFIKEVESTLNNIAVDLKDCVESFVPPFELDFAVNREGHPVLRNTEKNKPFINHLRDLNEFQRGLNHTPNHGDEQLQAKRRGIEAAIQRYRQIAQDHQLNLYRLQHTRAHKRTPTAPHVARL